MAKKSGIDWTKIGKEEPLIIFSAEQPYHRLLIIEFIGTKEVEINDKTPTQYSFNVKDFTDGKEKLWNITSKRLMRKLKEFEPLIGKGLGVKKIGSGYETNYTVKEIVKQED